MTNDETWAVVITGKYAVWSSPREKCNKRHVDRYQKWWVAYQAEKVGTIPGWTTIPAFPITVAKATVFLVYESTHEKVCPSLSLIPFTLVH